MASRFSRASRIIATYIALGIAGLAIVVWDFLDAFSITVAPPLVSDIAPAAGALAVGCAFVAILGLHLRSLQSPAPNTVDRREPAQMVSDAPFHDFTLHYSWPWKLFAPLCLVLGISLPLLRRYVEWQPPGPGDWVIGGLFVLLGGIAATYFSRVVSISRDAIEFKSAFGKTSLPWDQIVKVELTDDKFRLVSPSGKRKSVNMFMVNAALFARELDRRFDAGGLRLPT